MKKTIKTAGVAVLCLVMLGAGFLGGRFLLARSSETSNKIEEISAILENNWYYADQFEVLDEDLITQAISGNASLVNDPFTQYLSDVEATTLNLKLLGSNAGIGISYISPENEVIIKSVFVGSPADQAGLLPGDVLVSLNETPITPENSAELPEMIQALDGQPAVLEISRDGQVMSFTLEPADYDSSVTLDIGEDYGLVGINSFSSDTGDSFAKALERISSEGIDDLVIDLRDNTGGTVDAALNVASSLVDQNSTIFVEEYADGTQKAYTTKLKYSPYSFENIYILQNAMTASSSEILITSLQDNLGDIVTTVGQTSYGKGSVQDRFAFDDGTTIKFTRALWLSPDGRSINNIGIVPDVEVELLMPAFSYYGSEPVTADGVNPDARGLQLALRYLGYDVDRTDTYFSDQSAQALMQFQSEHGLEANGIGDEATFEVLIDAVEDKLAADTSDNVLDTVLALIRSEKPE